MKSKISVFSGKRRAQSESKKNSRRWLRLSKAAMKNQEVRIKNIELDSLSGS